MIIYITVVFSNMHALLYFKDFQVLLLNKKIILRNTHIQINTHPPNLK